MPHAPVELALLLHCSRTLFKGRMYATTFLRESAQFQDYVVTLLGGVGGGFPGEKAFSGSVVLDCAHTIVYPSGLDACDIIISFMLVHMLHLIICHPVALLAFPGW